MCTQRRRRRRPIIFIVLVWEVELFVVLFYMRFSRKQSRLDLQVVGLDTQIKADNKIFIMSSIAALIFRKTEMKATCDQTRILFCTSTLSE